jgi:ribose/xylose/arabinose/galactoside ABC-type transport system permease subunit
MTELDTASSVDAVAATAPDANPSPPSRPNGGRWARTAADVCLRYAMIGVLGALLLVANSVTPGFFEIGNVRNILTQNAAVGVVSIGMTFVIIAGGFDLSVSAVAGTCTVLFASFAGHTSIAGAVLGVLGCAAIAGLFNGLAVTKLKVNAFVATLGSSSIIAGLGLIYSDSQPIVPTKAGFDFLGIGTVQGIPSSILVLTFGFMVGGCVLARHVFGRAVFAVGGNAEAARLSGMRVDLIRVTTYVLSSLCAGTAGLIIASQTGVGQADVGANITLDSIAIVIIGGTSLLGGEGAMWRTLVGLLILATINNVFDSLALQTAAQSVVKGAIVIGAVTLDAFTRSRRN